MEYINFLKNMYLQNKLEMCLDTMSNARIKSEPHMVINIKNIFTRGRRPLTLYPRASASLIYSNAEVIKIKFRRLVT